ncbi:flavin reductase family protein [Kocuria arenosa]|uniref:flavin reductase family protein n=1 Tax=Kocuria arenosa TaxID=3071446 RepID=UPI0034D44084
MSETTMTERPSPAVDPRQLRHAFGKFATGVTVVTCRTPDGTPHGATVNAFTAVSLDPPLAQVTLIRGNKASQYLQDAPFAINIMAADQLATCLNFAGKPMKDPPKWRSDEGIPVLEGNAATIECKPWRIYDGGDHIIVIGEVIDLQINEADPLLFVSGKFRDLGGFSGGSPWDVCGDSLATGWFEGSTSFKSF